MTRYWDTPTRRDRSSSGQRCSRSDHAVNLAPTSGPGVPPVPCGYPGARYPGSRAICGQHWHIAFWPCGSGGEQPA